MSGGAGLLADALTALGNAVAALREQLAAAEARGEGERSRADRADAALTGERAKVDALRDRLEATQAELTEMVDAARVATEAADTLRVAEASRRALGRWARLRAAWRGR